MNCSDVNAWLDMLMDDELSAEQRKELEAHAAVCAECAENIRATIEIKNMLDDMKDEADVPLAAQAAWRKAVKQEAMKIKAKKTYRNLATVAASAVILIGVAVAFNGGADRLANDNARMNTAVVVKNGIEETDESADIAVIEADGAGQVAMARMMPEPVQASAMIECEMRVESVDDACGYISDLVAEYEGVIEVQEIDYGKANLYITIPSENFEAFMSASKHLDITGTAFDTVEAGSAENTTLLIILNS